MNRNLEDIDIFCNHFATFCEEVARAAMELKWMADLAGDSLLDEVGIKAVQNVCAFSDELIRLVNQSSEAVLTLKRQNRRIGADMEGILRKIR